MTKPLTAAMDNVLAWRMGEACARAYRAPSGDYIDTGLALLRELNENGFAVAAQGTPTRRAETTCSVGEADGGPVAESDAP